MPSSSSKENIFQGSRFTKSKSSNRRLFEQIKARAPLTSLYPIAANAQTYGNERDLKESLSAHTTLKGCVVAFTPTPTPPSKGSTVQCNGINNAGNRCGNKIKSADVRVETFCRYHSLPSPAKAKTVQCSGINNAGNRCGNKIKTADAEVETFCRYHLLPSPARAKTVQCSGVTKAGAPCGNKIKTAGAEVETFCRYHLLPSPAKAKTVQCSGVTKKGFRCSREIKSDLPLASSHPDADVERFCCQHLKQTLSIKGFYSHKVTDQYINFTDWIPGYLQPETQAALRIAMEKPHSQDDVAGYVYAYEIRDPKAPNQVHLKVGHTINVCQRIDQWDKQCPSKDINLRSWWPGTIADNSSGRPPAIVSLMKGQVEVGGGKGPCPRHVERLVHLELADLAMRAPYLEPGFEPNIRRAKNHSDANGSVGPSTTPLSTPTKKTLSPSAAKRLIDKPCSDCKVVHKEIFSMTRVETGRFKGHEWDLLVKPVIKKWGAFVSAYV